MNARSEVTSNRSIILEHPVPGEQEPDLPGGGVARPLSQGRGPSDIHNCSKNVKVFFLSAIIWSVNLYVFLN